MSHLWHNAWLTHCSEWCMRYFLCSLSVMQSHTLTIFLLYVQKAQGSLLRHGSRFPSCHKLTNCLKHAVQGSPFRSTLGVGYNKEIFSHFSSTGKIASFGFFWSFRTGSVILGNFPFQEVWLQELSWGANAFDSTARDVFLLCRGFCDKVIQSQTVILFPRPRLWV